MDKGDNTGRGLSSLSQLAEVQLPVAQHAQHVQGAHLADTSHLSAEGEIQDNAAVPTPEKLPKHRTKLPVRQDPYTVSLKDFKELMIRARLDEWKARAQLVYTPGQVDITALWSPQVADIESTKDGMISFDGFDRTWFVPFDLEAPIPAERQSIADDLANRHRELSHAHRVRIIQDRESHGKILRLIEDEVKETCWSQLDKDTGPHMALTQWDEVPGFVSMIARARLEDGREPLPGYYQAMVLELGIDGKITYQRISLPSDVDVEGLISRLESWYPHHDEHSTDIIKHFCRKLEFVS
ncbi:hypothetical protein FLAG1_05710 [Fusarium langsethiae]|uniref:Uncharacterized protein n=1 Tax=Fusarium langsethiae TaxID=179993 RepID=A0A0M9EX26_FUSLA|nr:hypothetical protein FLAG1_05710 [Fusarium langsethiae]GKU03278.1 unnamed protein product [Fusarium langsethiae]GKU11232.1 unnamed protein product [Fusarium langsethiae]